MEEKEKKKMSPKISRRFIIIGLVVLLIGIALICVGGVKIKDRIVECKRLDEQYKQEYAAWKERWFENPRTAGESPSFPDSTPSVGGILLCFGGGVVIMIGIGVTFVGLQPYITKVGAKMEKETLDYAGGDISAVGVRGIEVAEPIINKGVDVIAPNVEKVVRSAKNGVSGTTNSKGSHCTECGAKMEQNEAFCSNCGKKHANVCECGHTNDVNDKFCGKCGKPLK